jgi:hypothetical protein
MLFCSKQGILRVQISIQNLAPGQHAGKRSHTEEVLAL